GPITYTTARDATDLCPSACIAYMAVSHSDSAVSASAELVSRAWRSNPAVTKTILRYGADHEQATPTRMGPASDCQSMARSRALSSHNADDSALPLRGISWRSVRTGQAGMANVARPTPTMSRALAGRVESENLAVHPRPALETEHATARVRR